MTPAQMELYGDMAARRYQYMYGDSPEKPKITDTVTKDVKRVVQGKVVNIVKVE